MKTNYILPKRTSTPNLDRHSAEAINSFIQLKEAHTHLFITLDSQPKVNWLPVINELWQAFQTHIQEYVMQGGDTAYARSYFVTAEYMYKELYTVYSEEFEND